jgi:hypothetical protein
MADEPKTEGTGAGAPAHLREALARFPHLRDEYNQVFGRRLAERTAETRERLSELEQELNVARAEVDKLQTEHMQSVEELTAGHREQVETLTGDFRGFKAQIAVGEALKQAGFKEGLHPAATAILHERGLQVVDGDDDELQLFIDGTPLEEVLTDPKLFPDEMRKAPAGGGTGAQGSPLPGGAGGFEWAREAVSTGAYRRMGTPQRDAVNRALQQGRPRKD